MADVAGGQQNDASTKTILRLKRKRSEDPTDILLVSHAFKKSLREEQYLPPDGTTSIQRVFRLAGTVSRSDDKLLSSEVLSTLKSDNGHQSKIKMNPITIESINKKLRVTKKLANQKSRYKVISKCREEEEENSSSLAENENSDVDIATEEALKLCQLYDIILDELEPGESQVEPKSHEVDKDTNSILCNSVKMIREKLKIDKGKNCESLENDYVYDVYCAEDSYGGLSDLLDIVHVSQSQLVSEVDDDLEHYDDEDDSNDENNWRNDYPDEDDGQSSEDEARYRSENFSYGWEDRPDAGNSSSRMFSENLSSDEDQDYAYFGQKFGDYGGDKDEYNYEVLDEDGEGLKAGCDNTTTLTEY